MVYIPNDADHGTPYRGSELEPLSHRVLLAPIDARHGLIDHHGKRRVFVISGNKRTPS